MIPVLQRSVELYAPATLDILGEGFPPPIEGERMSMKDEGIKPGIREYRGMPYPPQSQLGNC